jgi:hypothetical protein
MKYFTPDLLARFGSPDDDIADAANAEWEEALKQYRKHLKDIYFDLPEPARVLAESISMHDAVLDDLDFDEKRGVLLLWLSPEDHPGNRVQVEYHLAAPLEVVRHGRPENDDPVVWLYDEFDVADADRQVFTHSILFAGGLELIISFTSVARRVYSKLLVRQGNSFEIAAPVRA